jgi:molybdenum cofactor cytidylyltransferase
MLLIHGASAILDRRDVIPAAIAAAGGRDRSFSGMPVDPAICSPRACWSG